MNKIIRLVLGGFFAFWVVSCSPQEKIAREFLASPGKPAIMVTMPDFLYKSNLKTADIKGYTFMTQEQKDSILWQSSSFLQFIDDSLLIETFATAFTSELKYFGYNVFRQDQLDTFLSLGQQAYYLDLAQMELEEYQLPYYQDDYFDDITYYKEFLLDAVNINSWFELTRINTDSGNLTVLYASHYVFDYLKGRFTSHPLTGEVKFKYRKIPMTVDDVIKLAGLLGRKYASYLHDHFMNAYIAERWPSHKGDSIYYHYDRNSRRLGPAHNDRFIILKEGF